MRVAFTSTPSTLKTLFKDALSERTVLWKIEDIDFDDARREEVINYIGERYGEDRVTEVITFDRYKLKSSVRNLGRIFGLKPTEQDAVADKIEDLEDEEDVSTIKEALDVSPELRNRREEDERFDRICKRADDLQGLARHAGRHPAAVIVTPGEMTDYVPTRTMKSGGEDHTVTHFDGDQLEDIGLLKIDVLGLAALNEIDTALEMAQDLGHNITEEDLDGRDDPAVYENIFAEGDTRGIFQFESGGMRQFLAEMEPTEFVHIAAMNALYRPGPMEQIPSFIARMHGEEETIYIDRSIHDQIKEDVADVLDDTYGIMVFQEQVMQVCRRLAGFDLGEADIMRRAIGKKKEKLLMEQKQKFVQGCIEQGYGRELGETIFQKIEEFADYAFNRCVSGDTRLWRTGMPEGAFHPTIEEMYRIRNDLDFAKEHGKTSLRSKYNMSGYGKSLSVSDEDRLIYNEVVDIRDEGIDEVFEVTTETGRTIKVNARHRFPTPEGKRRTDELEAGDKLFVRRPPERETWAPEGGIYGSPNNYPEEGEKGFQTLEDAPSQRWEQIKTRMQETVDSCERCGASFEEHRMEVHHRDGDYRNATKENAEALCPSCHKKEHYARGRTKAGEKGAPMGVEKIVSIQSVGEERVYDVEMAAPHHTFVTDSGIVTCNSHASSYAALAYKQAYLKCYCPAAFYAAAVQAEGDDDKRAALIRDLSERGVEVKRPSINESKAGFAATSDNVVRFGLSTIKNVGKQAQVFLEEREKGGPFESFMECLCRCTPNARAVKSLIKAGAFDDFDLSRATMMENHDKVLTYARKRRDYRQGSRKSMPDAPQVHEVSEFPRKSRFRQEREVAVTYTTGAPTDDVEWLARHLSGHEHVHKGTRYRLELATILEVRDATTSTGNRMWWVTYRTADGEVPGSAAMWDSTYEAISEHLEPDTPVVLVLETDVAGDYAGSYTVENAVPARQIPARLGQVACVETDSPEAARSALERLSQLPEGEMRAWVRGPFCSDTGQRKILTLGRTVSADAEALEELSRIGNLHLV